MISGENPPLRSELVYRMVFKTILSFSSITPSWSKAQEFCHSKGPDWALVDLNEKIKDKIIPYLQDECFHATHFWVQSYKTFKVKVKHKKTKKKMTFILNSSTNNNYAQFLVPLESHT